MLAPGTAPPRATAQPQSGWPAKIGFSLADLNPLRLIYDEVMKQATSNTNRASFAVGTPMPQIDWSNGMNSNFNTEFSSANMARINGEAIANQTRPLNHGMRT